MKTHFPMQKYYPDNRKSESWCGSKSSMFVCAPQVIRSIIAQQLQPRTCDSERGAERALARRFPLKRAQSFSRSQPAGFSSRKFPPKRQFNSFARERWKTRETINRHARTSFSVSVWSSGNPLATNSWSPRLLRGRRWWRRLTESFPTQSSDSNWKCNWADRLVQLGTPFHPIWFDGPAYNQIFPGTHTRGDPVNLLSPIWMNIAFSHRMCISQLMFNQKKKAASTSHGRRKLGETLNTL